MNQPLAEAIFWIAAVACAVAEMAILRFTFRARRIQQSDLVPIASRRGEIAWAIVPAVALSFLLVATWQRIEARETQMRMMDQSGMQHSVPVPEITAQSSPR